MTSLLTNQDERLDLSHQPADDKKVEVKKKKKKKKRKNMEDPFKDVKESNFATTIIVEQSDKEIFDTSAIVKVEDIEVSVDCNEVGWSCICSYCSRSVVPN